MIKSIIFTIIVNCCSVNITFPQKMCQIHGGHLVHVEEAAEDRFIVSLMDKNNCE